MRVGDLFTALRTAHSGLLAQQQALDVAAQNIANVNTPGYARRIVGFQTNVIAGEGRGVRLAAIQRSVDEGLLRNLRTELSTMHAAKVHLRFDARIQDQFGGVDANAALPHGVARLEAAFRSLATTPESTLDRLEVVRRTEDVAHQLRQMSTTIQSLRGEADRDLAARVDEVSTLLRRIADFNDKIVRANEMQQSAADALDTRDQALSRLAELMDVRIYPRPRGDVVVFTGSGRTLVDDDAAQLSHRPASVVSAGVSYAGGGFSAITLSIAGTAVDITGEIRGGAIAGLIDLRDRRLVDLQASLDAFAAGLRDQVNAAHNQGTAFPPPSRLVGSKPIVNPTRETLTYGSGSDTAIILFDADGIEVRRTTVRTLLGGADGGSIEAIRSALDGWLQPDGSASFDASGRLTLNVTTSGLGVGLLDVNGSQPVVLTHALDADDGGGTVRTLGRHEGFSAFFGLNDVFIGGSEPIAYASQLFPSGFAASAPASLKLVDGSGVLADVSVPAGATLREIARLLSAVPGMRASVIAEGGGERLSLTSEDGRSFRVADDGGGLLGELGFGLAAAGTGASLAVREDLARAPSLLATGQPTWQANAGLDGRYVLGPGDGRIGRAMADALAAPVRLPGSGRTAPTTLSLGEYAMTIVGRHAAEAKAKGEEVAFETALVDSLQAQTQSFSGVNLDEEMANLIVYEEAYGAAARVMAAIKEMFDALERAVA